MRRSPAPPSGKRSGVRAAGAKWAPPAKPPGVLHGVQGVKGFPRALSPMVALDISDELSYAPCGGPHGCVLAEFHAGSCVFEMPLVREWTKINLAC